MGTLVRPHPSPLIPLTAKFSFDLLFCFRSLPHLAYELFDFLLIFFEFEYVNRFLLFLWNSLALEAFGPGAPLGISTSV